MSLDPMVFAVKDAPTANPYEHSVLSVMADEAGEDGCGSFLSVPTIAERAKMSDREVRDCLKAMLGRGLIGYGDQSLAAYIRADRRPVVYDLLIPYEWYGSVGRVNQNRARRDLAPLVPDPCGGEPCASRPATALGPRCGHRPPIAAAPARKRRSDVGKKRIKSDGVNSSHLVHGVTDSPGGIEGRHGVNSKSVDPDLSQQVNGQVPPPRGAYQSPDPLTQTTNPSSPLPPVIHSAAVTQAEGGAEEIASPSPEAPPLVVAAALEAAPHWRHSVLVGVLADPDISRQPPDVVETAVLAVARGEHGYTASPRRLLEPGPWWADAYGIIRTGSRADEPAGPSPSAMRAACRRCDPYGFVLVPGTTDGEVMVPARRCEHADLLAPVG